jgi:rsbT antagonist protein RsbS
MNIDLHEKRIPIIKIGNFLIVSIQVDMHDKLAIQLQSQILEEIEKTGAKGVLIDISVLEMVDSFIGRMLSGMASMASIMDAAVVIVGMQPAVAITLVERGWKCSKRGLKMKNTNFIKVPLKCYNFYQIAIGQNLVNIQ